MTKSVDRTDHLRKDSNVSPIESLIAGSVSGAIARRAVTAPLDTIKIRLQLSSTRVHGKTGVELVKTILQKEGIAALWKGNIPAEALYILYGASQFTSYSVLNSWLSDFQRQLQFSLNQSTHSFLVGAGTGLISTVVTYPFDLLRTRLAAHESRKFLSMKGTCKDIYTSDGLRGFFEGIRPSLLSIVLSSGLFFWSYALARDAFDDLNKLSSGKIWGVEAISGFTAGVTAKAITFPLDTIRKRMQVSRNEGAFEMLVKHWRSYGFSNFYRGFGISLLKTAPTSALSVAVYEYTLTMIATEQ